MAKQHFHCPGKLVRRAALLLSLGMAVPAAFAQSTVVFEEHFENGNVNGWTNLDVPDEPDSDLRGTWIIGDPNGTFDPTTNEQAQPEFAAAGIGCAFTAQNQSIGLNDVDNGVVYFITPLIDLDGATTAELRYTRWYYNQVFNNDVGDFFVVEGRSSPATAWVELERLDDSLRANDWTTHTVALEAHIALTATVQVRFGASDRTFPGDILEAALDDVVVTADGGCTSNNDCGAGEFCSGQGACLPYGNGDSDADGDRDLADFCALQTCFGVAAGETCVFANLAGDAVVDLVDYATFAAALDGPL